ncbi:MAG: acetyltransferase [Bacillota bacterium]|jgi:sugar O-acyltransferase (sialic acid O-acetyltransferase NeuD family)|nr:acetyltransferase [Bacillota bacterium]
MKHLPVIIFGTAGLAKETYILIKQCNEKPQLNGLSFEFLGFVSEDDCQIGSTIVDNQKVIASDSTISDFLGRHEVIGAFLPFGFPAVKRKVYERTKKYKNIIFPTLIHPSVVYDQDTVHIGAGTIIAAGNVITVDCVIEEFNYINVGCVIGHDANLKKFNVVNPGALISGNVTMGNECLIGAGATILQGLSLEDGVTLGAGAVLTKNAKQWKTYIGVPAKEVKDR